MWRRSLWLLAGLVLLGGSANLLRWVASPLPDDGLRWRESRSGLVATSGSASGVLAGDRLLAVDGTPIRTRLDLVLLDRDGSVGRDRLYRLERGGVEREAAVRLGRGRAPRHYLLLALTGLAALFAAFRILALAASEPGAAPAAGAAIAFAAIALLCPCGWMDGWDRLAVVGDEVARLLLPPALVATVLAVGGVAATRWSVLLWLPALLLLAGNAIWLLAAEMLSPRSVMRWGRLLERAQSLEMALGVVAAASFATVLWLRAEVTTRESLGRLLRGAGLGLLPYVALVSLPRLLGWEAAVLGDAALLFLPLLPVAILDAFPGARISLRELARGGLATGSGILLAVGLALATAEVATGLFPSLGLPAWAAYLIAGSVLAVGFFERLRLALEGVVEWLFDRQGYEARRTLLAFGRELAVETRVDALADSLVLRLLRAFSCARAALYVVSADGGLVRVGRRLTEGGPPVTLPATTFENLVPSAGKAVALASPWADTLGVAGFELGVPLVSRGRLCGLLVLSRPRAFRFGGRERRLLADLSGYVAVALDHSVLLERALRQAGEIRELEQFRLSVIESLGIGLAIVDLDGRILSTNGSFRELVGRELLPAQAVARDVLPVELLDPPPEGRVERRSCGERTLALSTKLLRRADGSVQGRILVAEDVTLRVAEEAERLRREKLATVGILASGVAHEINTPLAGIASYVQMIADATAADDPRRLLLEKVEKQSFRAARMVRNLLNFARASDEKPAPFRLEAVVGEALSLLEHATRRGRIVVETDFAQAVPDGRGRCGEIEQVALNLIKNAIEAMPGGGRLLLATGARGDEVWFSVEDSGSGMDARTRARLFEPFFTTKERGQGHGLGLAVSSGIVEAHGGRLEVESTPGSGTRFRVWLPAAVEIAEAGRVNETVAERMD